MRRFTRRSLLRTLLLVGILLLPGTPQVLAQEEARAALQLTALEAAQVTPEANSEQERTGIPPDADELRNLQQAPTLSGANPPYPHNHILDGQLETTSSPPSNHDFETAGYDVGIPPTNFDLEAAGFETGIPPTNYDFETGDLTGWTTGGNPTVETDPSHGWYGKLNTSSDILISDAFTIDASVQALSLDLYWLNTNGHSGAYVYVLSGTGYATETQVLRDYCYQCGSWDTLEFDPSPWQGQSVKLKISYYVGPVGVDTIRMQVLFPDVTTSGLVTKGEESGNSYARLLDEGVLITSPFTVDAETQLASIQARKAGTSHFYLYIEVLSGTGYITVTEVFSNGTNSASWAPIFINLSAWAGESIKLRIRQYGVSNGHIDDLGLQRVEIPEWDVTGDTRREEESGNHVIATNGKLTSQPFTLPEDIQHLLIPYRAASSLGIFWIRLLGGPDFSEELFTVQVTSTDPDWHTETIGVEDYAGQTVKLQLEQYWGRLHFDDVGYGEKLLPHWELIGTNPLAIGEDAAGSYITPADGSIWVRSSLISTGLIDSPSTNEQRYYSLTYAFGDVGGGLVRVVWHNTAGQSWFVHQDASNEATGIITEYFWLAELMGEDGYFTVQVPREGKVYSIAGNIPRMHLSEPYSEKVGLKIDTSTGSFGYQETDIQTVGSLPLTFTRYYSGHSTHVGVMGYRWTHTYDIRFVVLDNDDAGVIYGSGREVFFDWYTYVGDPPNRYIPTDPRVHDDLVKNGDGSYTYTTTTNLSYHFNAAGVLQSITDLNGNQITLSYDGAGRLTTVTGLGNQIITLGYDPSGRLSTVTDPASQVWTYTYDAAGDLVRVTDPDGGERDYSYDRHLLTQAINPLDDVLFTNTFDDWNRVTAQTDADSNTLIIAYDTPGIGATQVTDPESNTATFYFDKHQRTTHLVDPQGHVITRYFDGNGNLVRVIDPENNEWEFAYSSGDVTKLTDPLGNEIETAYNAEHLPTTVTDARGQSTTFTYNASGNVLTKTDPLNHTWTYTYDAAGNVLTRTDPLNHTTTYDYDLFGRPTMVTDALGGDLQYQYSLWLPDPHTRIDPRDFTSTRTFDEEGRITSITDEAGKVTTYGYDANGNLTTVTDPLNQVTSYAYDENNRMQSQTNPLSETTSYTYEGQGRLATETDPLGRVTSYGYDDAGRLISRTLPNSGVWTYAYDANGNLTSTTNPLNQTTSYTYDANNQLLSSTDAKNQTTSYAYDAAGRLVSITNALNQTTTYTYDAAGNLLTETDPLNRTWTYTYDPLGHVLTETNPLSETTSYTYDALGRLLTETNPLNQTTTYSYNANGQRTSVTLPSGSSTTYSFGPRGLLTSVTDPLLHATTYVYDDAGQRISMTDRRNNTTSYAYDAAGRLTSMTDALGGVVGFAYDPAGQMTGRTDPNSQTWTFTYDALGNQLTETDPLGRVHITTYDLLGQVTSTTDARNSTVGYSYDANGNLTDISYAGGSDSYDYDALNRRTDMTDATGITSWTYDAAGQVTAVTSSNGVVGYGYDAAGRRASMTLPGSRSFTYSYDAAGRTSSVTDWLSETITFGYDADNNRTSITRPSGVSSTYTYNVASWVTNIDHSGQACQCSLQSFAYTYDAEGNRTSVTTPAGTESYTLDALNRLTNVTYANGDSEAFTYDPAGNRLTHEVNGVQVASYSYDVAGQLLSDGTTSYGYDATGNLTTAGADSYTWNWDNRLTSATVSGTTETYTYDGEGVRLSSSTGGSTTGYL